MDQYFGTKELYEVVLRAKTPMQFGTRMLEEGEPVLYFENISMSSLSEKSHPIMARGGWANLPRVIWEDRTEVQFVLQEGVMSSISMGILLSANVAAKHLDEPLLVNKREGPLSPDSNGRIYLQYDPYIYPDKKIFLLEYDRNVAQKKVFGKKITGVLDGFGVERHCVELYEDKALTEKIDNPNREFVADYYFQYNNEALIYTIQKERFNGLFSLEGKFYSKDENEGMNYTNLIYMPKVRIVSDINLRLGERADPTMSVFNIIAMPENVGGNKKSLILEITRLSEDIDGNII